jgi:SulP family sulfate permease
VQLIRSSWGDAVVLLATFLLTNFRDLTEGILVGFALGAVLFIHRMAQDAGVHIHPPLVPEDMADDENGGRGRYDASLASDPDVVVYRITGAFFFGAASTVGAVLDRIADQRKSFVIDFSAVSFIDSTAAKTIAGIAKTAARHGVKVILSGASIAVRRQLVRNGVKRPLVTYAATVAQALKDIGRKPTTSSTLA